VHYVYSPYGLPPQVPCPIALGDPSTPRHDASYVDLSFLFKSDFKFLNLSHSFLLQGSQMGQAPVMPWGGSPCDILTQGLIELIEYSYHQGIPSFPEAHLQRTLWLSMLGPKQFQDGDRLGSFPGCAQVRTKVCRKE
jgi:hypothetical protein